MNDIMNSIISILLNIVANIVINNIHGIATNIVINIAVNIVKISISMIGGIHIDVEVKWGMQQAWFDVNDQKNSRKCLRRSSTYDSSFLHVTLNLRDDLIFGMLCS